LNLDKNVIEQIVSEVVKTVVTNRDDVSGIKNKNINIQSSPAIDSTGNGIFNDLNSAIYASREAFEELSKLSLSERKKIIIAIREAGKKYAEDIAKRTYEETGMGRVEDKIKKMHIASDQTPGVSDLETKACSGDNGLTIVERAPYGVISAVTPSTHPVPTLINNAISMIAAGNAVFFNPHPGAKKVFLYGLQIINDAIKSAGGPANLLTCLANPTIETTQQSFDHPEVNLITVTGGPGVVNEALKHPKRVIAAGPGNPPVIVDETADIKKAAKYIVDGGTFDNNIFCTAEKEIFVVDSVADKLKQELLNYHCSELNYNQINQLSEVAIIDRTKEHPVMNRKLVGRNARVLAESIGIKGLDDSYRLLIGEVEADHIFVKAEQLMPFMPIVRVKNVDEAIELAVKYEHGFHHTAIMHSLNLKALDKMARVSNVSIFVKNGPSYAGLGVTGEGTTTFTIAGTTGEGITTASTFTRMRRCALVDYFRIV